MVFKREVENLLVICNRCCCICHRFCGIKIEIDHIHQKSESKDDSIENAIPLCFDCHAEVHMYNNDHPKGRRYSSEELKLYKDRWIKICESNSNPLVSDMNPKNNILLSLMDELEFNKLIAKSRNYVSIPFETNQFHEAINSGIISFLRNDIKESIFTAYATLKETNRLYHDAVNNELNHGKNHPTTQSSKKDYNDANTLSITIIENTMKMLAT